MECTFQVGDRVVLVKEPGRTLAIGGNPGLVKGGIYTVSWVGIMIGGEVGLRFQEIPPVRHVLDGLLGSWNASYFRPVKPLSFWLGEKQHLDEPLHAHHIGASMSASISRAAVTCQGAPPRMLGVGGETWRNASCLSAPLAAARGHPMVIRGGAQKFLIERAVVHAEDAAIEQRELSFGPSAQVFGDRLRAAMRCQTWPTS